MIYGKDIIEHSPLPTFVVDSEGKVVIVNEAFLKAYNIPDKETVLGKNALSDPSNIRNDVVKYLKDALNGEVVETSEVDFTTPEGRRVVTKSRLFPIFDGDQDVQYVVVMHEDITERKKAEEEKLRAKKEAAAAKERAKIMEAVSEYILILNKDLKIIDCNETFLKRIGY